MKFFWLTTISVIFMFWLILDIVNSWPDEYVHIVFCDVGQGDAILVVDGYNQMLIDGGKDESVLECLDEYIPYWDRKIEVVVATHMDSDHIGGLPDVLAKYSTNYILTNPSNKKTADFEAFRDAVSRKTEAGAYIVNSVPNQEFWLSSLVRSIVISPNIDFSRVGTSSTRVTETVLSDSLVNTVDYELDKIDENDLSIGLFIIIDEVSVLLTGDLEEEGELAVIDSGLTQYANIQKAGHHGSKTSSTRQFIDDFKPEVVVVSSGKNNQYNHPSTRVIDLFRELEVQIYQTESLGNIEFVTDGIKYWRAI